MGMRPIMIMALLGTVLLLDNGYGQDNIYTWRDKNGVLNITDVPPPQGAEILDVSPSYRQQAEEHQRQRRMLREREIEEAVEAQKRLPGTSPRVDRAPEQVPETTAPKPQKQKRKGY